MWSADIFDYWQCTYCVNFVTILSELPQAMDAPVTLDTAAIGRYMLCDNRQQFFPHPFLTSDTGQIFALYQAYKS